MMASWIGYSLATAVLFGLAAAVLQPAARAAGLPVRWIWVAAVLGSVVVLPLAAVLRSVPARVEATVAVSDSSEPSPASPFGTFAPAAAQSFEPSVGRTLPRGDRLSPEAAGRGFTDPRVDAFLLSLWLALSLAAAGTFLLAYWTMARRRRRWREARVAGRVAWVSEDTGPAVFGFFRPRIVLPEWLLEGNPHDLELALEHEEEHVRTGDPRLLLAGLIACVLLPWNAAVWWSAWRLRQAVELDCDARLVARGADVRGYARLLVAVADRGMPGRFAVCALSASPSFLERRIHHLMRPPSPGGRFRAAAAVLAATLLLTGALRLDEPESPWPGTLIGLADGERADEAVGDEREAAGLPDGLAAEAAIKDFDPARIVSGGAPASGEASPGSARVGLESPSPDPTPVRSASADTIPVPEGFEGVARRLEEIRGELERRAGADTAALESRLRDLAGRLQVLSSELASRGTVDLLEIQKEVSELTQLLAGVAAREELRRQESERELELLRRGLSEQMRNGPGEPQSIALLQRLAEAQEESARRLAERQNEQQELLARLRQASERWSYGSDLSNLVTCVIEDGELREVPDLLGGHEFPGIRPRHEAYPEALAALAVTSAWILNRQFEFDGRQYRPFGTARRLTPRMLQKVDVIDGAPIFSERGRTRPIDMLYALAGGGCMFQPFENVARRRY